MKLGSICPAPCFREAANFDIPRPGCSRQDLEFSHADGRRFYAVLLSNHEPGATVDPKLAIVGLSPAGTQIASFIEAYRKTSSYGKASVQGAFAGLAPDIIAMIEGLGLAERLDVRFPNKTLAYHPDVYVTSMVACASLTSDYSSDDFNPRSSAAATRCATVRLVDDLLRPTFKRLTHVLLLGSKSWEAAHTLRTPEGRSIIGALVAAGKVVLNLPHPSGQNREYVNLASLPTNLAPPLTRYVDEKWEEYRIKPPRQGRKKENEAKYKAKRTTVWNTVDSLRKEVAKIGPRP